MPGPISTAPSSAGGPCDTTATRFTSSHAHRRFLISPRSQRWGRMLTFMWTPVVHSCISTLINTRLKICVRQQRSLLAQAAADRAKGCSSVRCEQTGAGHRVRRGWFARQPCASSSGCSRVVRPTTRRGFRRGSPALAAKLRRGFQKNLRWACDIAGGRVQGAPQELGTVGDAFGIGRCRAASGGGRVASRVRA